MKFTVQKQNLLAAMDIAYAAVPSNTTLPVMYSFRIEVDGMEGVITANDLGTSIRTRFSTMAEDNGAMCVNAKTLMQAVKKISASEITFEQDGNAVIVTGGKARFEFPLEDITAFADPPSINDDNIIKMKVDAQQFAGMINRISFAVAKNNNNKVLTGINLKIASGNMTLTALDLVMVAIRQMPISVDDVNVIIPQKAMVDLAKSLTDGEVDIAVAKNHVIFDFGNTMMTVRLIDGNYFKIEQMFKNRFDLTVDINRPDFMACLDRSLVVMKDNDKSPIVVTIQNGHMNVTLKNNISAFSEDIDCSVNGGDIRIGLNPAKLHEILKNIESDEITLSMVNGASPVFIKNEELGYTYVLLPVNI